MWQVSALFLLGAVLTAIGAMTARWLALAAESDGPTLASRWWWAVCLLSAVYAAASACLAFLREGDDGAAGNGKP